MSDEEVNPKSQLICPKCGSADIRRSKSEGFVGFFNQMFGRWPFRCRSCRIRFYRSASPPGEP